MLTGRTWSCSAHAVDIWTSPEWELREKLKDCQWLTTCTRTNSEYLSSLTNNAENIHLAYHGIDLDRFRENPTKDYSRSGELESDPVRILSVGRAVEKKGYPELLTALSKLPDRLNWRFVHIGGGAMIGDLKQLADRLEISGRIDWLGARSQEDVLEQYGHADIFALASRVAKNGDRDGLPNVLMEAQSQGIPCVSTRVSAIPELIEDGVTGLLADQDDIAGLTASLSKLIANPQYREQIGKAGNENVRRKFAFSSCVEYIAKLFALGPQSDAGRRNSSVETA